MNGRTGALKTPTEAAAEAVVATKNAIKFAEGNLINELKGFRRKRKNCVMAVFRNLY